MRERGPWSKQHESAGKERSDVVTRVFELDRDGTHRILSSPGDGCSRATREECMRAHPSSQARPLHLV